jgi:hypothetical protein
MAAPHLIDTTRLLLVRPRPHSRGKSIRALLHRIARAIGPLVVRLFG